MENSNTRAIILAAGRSTRFKTTKCKLLYSVCGQAMILYPLRILQKLNIPVTVIVGYQADQIIEEVKKAKIENVDFVLQEQQLGTGHAVASSRKTWDKKDILIINGDAPLLTEELISQLLNEHQKNEAVVSFLCSHAYNPFGYGRVIREHGKINIVEERNCTQEQRFTTLINSGIYVMSKNFLEQYIDSLKVNSSTGEFYVTDLVNFASDANLHVHSIPVPYDNVRGVNTLEELWAVEQIKRSEFMKYWMARGVRFELAQSIHLDWDVEIGPESFIGTGAHLLKGTKIGKNSSVNAFSIVENTLIGDNVSVRSHSVIQNSVIKDGANVGPFVRVRDNAVICENAQLGNFVEVKKSYIGQNSKAKHLAYIGDTITGKAVNIGAGTITCNYDGFKKHETIIEDGAFIGSNNTLVAPLKIGKNSYTAGGSTINKDVPEKALAIGRARQENKEDYFEKKNQNKTEEEQEIVKKKENKNQETLSFMGAIKNKDNVSNL